MAYSPATTVAVALLLIASSLSAQKPTVPPVDPQLSSRIKQLKTFLRDRKMLLDFQAIGLIQVLSTDVDNQNPKDKTRIIKTLGEVYNAGKVRTGSKVILYRETTDALVRYGKDGAKPIRKYVESKRFEDDYSLRGYMLKCLGKTKDLKQIKFLLEITTRSPRDELRAASGEALGNYNHAKSKDQHTIVKDIIRAWGSLDSLATSSAVADPNGPNDFGPQNARRTLRSVEGKWVSTLQKLTGVTNSKFKEWQRWLNKNKNWKLPK